MKILSCAQLTELDKYTISHEPIASIDLMERASLALTNAIVRRWGKEFKIAVFAGPGNNGGDALAVCLPISPSGKLQQRQVLCNCSMFSFGPCFSLSPALLQATATP